MNLELISRLPKGKGRDPLLFVHGAYCGAWIWDEYFLPYFAECGFPSHAVSLRGHGGSDGHDMLDWHGLSDYLDDLATAIDRVGGNCILIGHSMGGLVIQRYLERRQAPAVVLLASLPPSGLMWTSARVVSRNPGLFWEMAWFQGSGADLSRTDEVRRAMFTDKVPAALVARYAPRMQRESQRALWDLTWGRLPSLAPHQIPPMLVLGASHDPIIPEIAIRETAEAYRVTWETVEDSAHAMMLEPEWRAAADKILAWLEEQGF